MRLGTAGRVLCVLMLLAPALLLAGTTGKIAGVVTDAATGEGLPGVSVRIEGTSLGAATDIEGRYTVLNVPPGLHDVTSSYVGYKRTTVRGVRVSVDFTTKLDMKLEKGDIELDAIEVQGERTPLVRMDLTNPVASISTETIQALPVTTIDEVIGLQAGVIVDDDGSIHVRGGEGNEIAFTLNGVNINNPYNNLRSVGVATNAVQEVSVSAGTFSAEYGSALSGVVNYVTREGASAWTGNMRYLTGDYATNRTDLYPNASPYELFNVQRVEAAIGGPVATDELRIFASGVYAWSGGFLYGERLYLPADGSVTRPSFPSGDPRRTGSSSDPLYFSPYYAPTADSVGLPSGDGSLARMNWSRSYNVQTNLSYRFDPTMRLKGEFIYEDGLSPSSSGNSWSFATRYKPDGRAMNTGKSYVVSADWNHSFSDNGFYTVKASWIDDKAWTQAYDEITDPRYVPEFLLTTLPNTSFLTGGVDMTRATARTRTFSGKADLVTQLFPTHEVRAGIEVRSHTIDVDDYDLRFGDPADPSRTFDITSALEDSIPLVPIIPTFEQGRDSYTRKPLQLAAYLQDKIEVSSSIILNLGLRYEYFDPAAQYVPDISGALTDTTTLQSGRIVQGFEDAEPKHMVSPRISVSYPITDRGTIRFSYGHFYQIANLSTVYRNPFWRAQSGTTPSFGNPNVNPQRSIQYEIGLQQGVTENIKVDLTAYYKDVRDYIYSQNIQASRGSVNYFVLTNLNYANTRGISLSLVKRRGPGELLSGSLDYTFQVAEKNRTEPSEDLFYNESRGTLTETYLVPFGFDRTHVLTGTVGLTQTDDWSASLIGWLRTGTAYTPVLPSDLSTVTYVENSDRQQVQWNVDLRVEKFFRLDPLGFSVYLQVDNLFDTENELFVYSNTGRALYNLDQTVNPEQFTDIRSRIRRGQPGLIPEKAIDDYYYRAQNLNTPRLVRLGFSLYY